MRARRDGGDGGAVRGVVRLTGDAGLTIGGGDGVQVGVGRVGGHRAEGIGR